MKGEIRLKTTTITKKDRKTKEITSYKFANEKSAVLFCKLCVAVDNKNETKFRSLLERPVTKELINSINMYIGRKVVFAKRWQMKRHLEKEVKK